MRVTLVTHGSRGDVQPVVALASVLAGRGHEVVVGAPTDLTGFASRLGLSVVPLAFDTQAALDSPRGRQALAKGSFLALTTWLAKLHHARSAELDDDVLRACEGADVIVAHFLLEERAAVIAEQRGIPLVILHSHPVRRSRVIAHPLVRGPAFRSGLLNLATHLVFEQVWWGRLRSDTNRFRAALGLPANRRSIAGRRLARHREVQIYSPHLVEPLAREWSAHPTLTFAGFISLGARERALLAEEGVEGDLGRWLAAGEPPVSFGFGSMPLHDAAAVVTLIQGVCRALGIRGLIVTGQPEALQAPEIDPAVIHIVPSADHATVLPKVRAAVHHGGAGTLAAALLAGLPTLVCSFFVDQPFWGARLEALGVGAHLRFADVNANTLLRGVRTLLEPEVAARAAALGERLRSEKDGAVVVAELIEEMTFAPER